MDTPPRALEGLRVLDQTQVMAGPFCAMLLADMGAEVIKIEPPGGDATRAMDLSWRPASPHRSWPSIATSAASRSTSSGPRAWRVLKELAATADVLVENYRPGVAERLGVDYATLSALNPAADLLLDLRLRPDRALRRPRRLRSHRAGHERHHERHGERGRRAGEGRRAHHRSGRRALRRLRHPLRAPRAPRDGPRPARGHLALRGRPGALRVGGDRVLVHGTDPARARDRAPPERAVPGLPRQRRPLHRRRRQQQSVPALLRAARPRPPGEGPALRHGRAPSAEPRGARAADRGRHRRPSRARTGWPGARRPACRPARSTACRRRSTTPTRGRATWSRSCRTPRSDACRASAIR